MSTRLLRYLAYALLGVCIFTACNRSEAQVGGIDICSKGCVVEAAIVGALVIAGVVTAVYFIARTPRTTGCLVSGSTGLTLETSDAVTYILSGAPPDLKPGDRVKIIGRKKKINGVKTILVTRMTKDYGACPANWAAKPATP